MSDVLKHRFVSPKLDGADLTQVQPSAWNDGHRFVGGAHGAVLMRDTSDATFGASWATPAAEGWVSYVPPWWINAVGVQPGAGGHAITGSYLLRGNAAWFQIKVVLGIGAIGPGAWEFGVPFQGVPHVSPGGGMLVTTVGYPLWAFFTPPQKVLLLYLQSNLSLATLSGTAPAALGNGHSIEVRGNYQALGL